MPRAFVQEAIVIPPWVALAIRPRPGVWEYIRVHVSELAVEQLSVSEYLQFKEQLVNGRYARFLSSEIVCVSLCICLH